MCTTNTPIKVLLLEFPHPCADWLLDTTEANIHIVQDLTIEQLQKEPLRIDSLLQVTYTDGQQPYCILKFKVKAATVLCTGVYWITTTPLLSTNFKTFKRNYAAWISM